MVIMYTIDGGLIMEEEKMNFGDFNPEFNGYDFNSMTMDEMEESKNIIKDIRGLLGE